MTKQYDEELRFILHKTKEKNHDRSPDYWGQIQINGKKWKLSGWVNQYEGIGGQAQEFDAYQKAQSDARGVDSSTIPF